MLQRCLASLILRRRWVHSLEKLLVVNLASSPNVIYLPLDFCSACIVLASEVNLNFVIFCRGSYLHKNVDVRIIASGYVTMWT